MHYIYAHIKDTTGEVFYIGKGIGKRVASKQNRSTHWQNIVNKYGYDWIMLETDLTEEEANVKEIYWISRLGRRDKNQGCLINFTDGGEGTCGRIVSENVRKAVSEANKKRIVSDAQRNVYKNLWKGKSGSLHNRSKKVVCTNDGNEFGSMSEAERFYNLGGTTVSWSVRNKRPIFGLYFEIKQ